MAKAPKNKTPPKTDEKSEKKDKGFWDINPLDCLNDLVTGAVFDGPAAITKTAETETEEENNDNAGSEETSRQASSPSGFPSININLGDSFRRVKPKRSPAPATTEKAGKAAGVDEQAEDE